ncbi:MAG: pyruvate dehydrogenase (acetyl-transferring) E1 component subunit alpha [Chloroflexi bacterium]|nr:pyruvate dehydrogenase (acetyl-transferring) E1 component subunit alpha [Chloroflexota bacterium]
MRRYSKDELLRLHNEMLLIRRFEEKAAEMYVRAKIGGYLHLNIGEEAVVAGAFSALEPADYVFSYYREHGHALARGADPKRVMAELLGKATGLCRGRGGSMHLFDTEHRLYGGWGIVGQSLPQAVGAGIYIDYTGGKEVCLCIFGEGATDIGAFGESLNLASLWNLPVIFLCVNNQYAMGTRFDQASAQEAIWRKSVAFDMYGERVDGMDVLAVRQAMEGAIRRARVERKPSLLEAVAYRYVGHSMADPGLYRTSQEVDAWKQRDPITNFRQILKEAGMIDDRQIKAAEEEVAGIVAGAVEFAESSPYPSPEDLPLDIYAP